MTEPIPIHVLEQKLADIKEIADHPNVATRLAKEVLVSIGKKDETNHCDCCKPPLAKFIKMIDLYVEKQKMDQCTDAELFAWIQHSWSHHDLCRRLCTRLLNRFDMYVDWNATNDQLIEKIKQVVAKRAAEEPVAAAAVRMRELWLKGQKNDAVALARVIMSKLGFNSQSRAETQDEFILRASALADQCKE